ncbi:MAG: hypothetical protein IPM54_06330 [Polyangiaceae bacterium]|nr:hypothetical protein [Polyangiaceae bacterium]
MDGFTDLTAEAERGRLFDVRFGPEPLAGQWTLRVRQIDMWTQEQRDAWVAHIQGAFVHLAVVSGLSGGTADPRVSVFREDLEVWEVGDWLEWRFRGMNIDLGAASLLLNLCEWATFNIAPAVEVEVLAWGLAFGPEPANRPLPRRRARLSFPTVEQGQVGRELSIQVEFARRLDGNDVARVSRFLQPWYTALVRWGFALPNFGTGMSDVHPCSPPLVVVEDLYCYDFDVFTARYEAVDVMLNCLDWIHHSVCPVRAVAIE